MAFGPIAFSQNLAVNHSLAFDCNLTIGHNLAISRNMFIVSKISFHFCKDCRIFCEGEWEWDVKDDGKAVVK